MIYLCLLLIGVFGFAAQVGLGFLHGQDGAHGHGHNGHGQDVSGHGAGHGTHAMAPHAGAFTQGGHHGDVHHGDAHHHEDGHAHTDGKNAAASWLSWISPLTIFSIALGAGVAGMLLKAVLGEPWLGLSAFAAGLVLNVAVVRPLMGILLSFASKPASALKGTVAKSAEAVSRFDERGRGIVRITVDGQTVRLLAELETEDTAQANTIRPGESLTVTSVDGKKNTCRVARM